MKKEQQDLHCSIVSDLLPLYHDGVVSETTAEAVQAHLAHCDNCTEEYRALCAQIPMPQADITSTKEQFDATMKQMKKKRVLRTVLTLILTGALLIAAFCFLIEIPLVPIPDADAEIACTYRYEVDGESYFFVLFSTPGYTGYSNGKFSEHGGTSDPEDPYTLVITRKKTVFARETDFRSEEIWIMNAEGSSKEYDALQFGGTTIWTEEAYSEDPVPEYVYYYHAYEQAGSEMFNYWIIDIERDLIAAQQIDGKYLAWNLDGDLLYDGYPDETGSYPDLPF